MGIKEIVHKVLLASFSLFLVSPAMADESFMKANMLKYTSQSTESWVMNGCAGDCTGDTVAIVSYGGGKPFANAAFNATSRLYEEGRPVAYIMARDNNNERLDAVVRTYIDGKPYGRVDLDAGSAVIDGGMVKVKDVEGAVYRQGLDTHKEFIASRISR